MCDVCQGINADQSSPPNGNALFSTEAAPGPKQEKKSSLTKTGDAVVDVPQTRIIATLAKYLWMKDNSEFRLRVLAALGLLIGAKVNNREDLLLFVIDVYVLRWFHFVFSPFGLGCAGD